MSWNRGYYTESSYTSFFFREISPSWLDYAALLQGVLTTRRPGEGFNYLELGCGTGYGLCLLASMFPLGNFVGGDFHPDHIGQALRLKKSLGVENVSFLDLDLIEAAERGWIQDPCLDENRYDYVVTHGVLSWVSREVQDAIMQVASRHLRHGGLFYCSYNTNPGWLSASIFRELAEQERLLNSKADPYAIYQDAGLRLGRILGSKTNPNPLGSSYPGLFALVEALPGQMKSYLLQEYATSAWQPFWCAEVHRRTKEFRLSHIGTAALTEIGRYFMPEHIRRSIEDESCAQTLASIEDIATNKSFRRDLFVKGGHRLLPHESKAAIEALRVRSYDLDPSCNYEFQTSFGLVKADPDAYQALENAVDSLSPTVQELCQALDRDLGEVLPMMTLLIQAGRLYLERDDLSGGWQELNCEMNLRLVELIASGYPFTQIPVAISGLATPFSTLEAIVYRGINAGLSGDFLVGLTLSSVGEIGHSLTDPEGNAITSQAKAVSLIQSIEKRLIESRLPLLSRLGAI